MDDLRDFAKSIEEKIKFCNSEEATKTALILPLLHKLGWDIFSPLQVIPEYYADIGTKKGERVDYALKVNNEISILLECKAVGVDLNKYGSQLFRYFSVTPATIGILTDGVEYRIYTDSSKQNIMDIDPVYTFNMLNMSDYDFEVLSWFKYTGFSAKDVKKNFISNRMETVLLTMILSLISNPSDKQLNTLYKIYSEDFNDSEDKVSKAIFKKSYHMLSETMSNGVLADLLKTYNIDKIATVKIKECNKVDSEQQQEEDYPSLFDDEEQEQSVACTNKTYRQQVMQLNLVALPMLCSIQRNFCAATLELKSDLTIILKAGSYVRLNDNKSRNFKSYQKFLSDNGKLKQDIEFASVSTAASFVLGIANCNGWDAIEYQGVRLSDWFKIKAKENNIAIN